MKLKHTNFRNSKLPLHACKSAFSMSIFQKKVNKASKMELKVKRKLKNRVTTSISVSIAACDTISMNHKLLPLNTYVTLIHINSFRSCILFLIISTQYLFVIKSKFWIKWRKTMKQLSSVRGGTQSYSSNNHLGHEVLVSF